MNRDENHLIDTFSSLSDDEIIEFHRIVRKMPLCKTRRLTGEKCGRLPQFYRDLEESSGRELFRRGVSSHPEVFALTWCSDCGCAMDLRTNDVHLDCSRESQTRFTELRRREIQMREHRNTVVSTLNDDSQRA